MYTLSFYAKRFNRYDAWAGYDYWDLDQTYHQENFPSKESELRHNQYVKLTYQFTWKSGIMNTAWIRIKGGAEAVDGWSTLQIDNVEMYVGTSGGNLLPHVSKNVELNASEKLMNSKVHL